VTNSRFHTLAYFATMLLSVGFSLFAYYVLRGKISRLSRDVGSRLFGLLRSALLWLLIAFSLGGFFSVSFRGCDTRPYDDIVADRQAVVEKNRKQLGVAISGIQRLLLVYAVLGAVGVIALRKRQP